MLIGHDLVKPEPELLLAYDDPLQVTAAFNRNLLRRINDELGGTFDLEGFAHRAVWNAVERRVEMHLVSRRRQHVRIAAGSFELTFEPEEYIWTESSYKYQASQAWRRDRRGFKAASSGSTPKNASRDAAEALTRFHETARSTEARAIHDISPVLRLRGRGHEKRRAPRYDRASPADTSSRPPSP